MVWNGATVEQGAELTPTKVVERPAMTWEGTPDDLFTIVYSDPDAPSTTDRKFGEWLHWLVVNVPGCDVGGGDELAAYFGSAPGDGSGKHRYSILLYKQSGRVDPDAVGSPFPISGTSGFEPRRSFKSKEFASKNGLTPVDGVGFLAAYDDMVPALARKLKGEE